MNEPRPRYFQIGFHRCGTTALAAFFERCGLPCVHHDRGRLARRLREHLAAGRPPLPGVLATMHLAWAAGFLLSPS